MKNPINFWNKVQRGDKNECWEWQAAKNCGYGSIKWGKYNVHAHRVAYELTYGVIPEGLLIMHECDNRLCCNPQHLWMTTSEINNKDKALKGRSFIPVGELNGRYVHGKRMKKV